MVDATDLKSVGPLGCAGSIPARATYEVWCNGNTALSSALAVHVRLMTPQLTAESF